MLNKMKTWKSVRNRSRNPADLNIMSSLGMAKDSATSLLIGASQNTQNGIVLVVRDLKFVNLGYILSWYLSIAGISFHPQQLEYYTLKQQKL
jgi:hypothetical protein